jgi:succinate dehydrogenase/fumarate reductase flavoprotein subunit
MGGGGSGLAAAIAAAEAGATVAVLEKAPYLLGSTGRSIGSIAASRTPDQRKLGVNDSPEEHAEDYLKIAGKYADREDLALVRLLTEGVTEAYNWLRSLGMEFFGPVPDPGNRYPRLHNILPTSRSYIYHLGKRARRVGVRIFLGTGGDELVQEGERVVGVRAIDATGAATTFRGRRGVILTSGDFSNGAELKRELISDEVANYVAVNPFAHGDAQRMARKLGAQILGGEVFDTPTLRFMPPPSEGLYGFMQKLPPGVLLTRPIKWGLTNLPSAAIRALLMGFMTTYLSPDVSLFANGAILIDSDGRLQSDTADPIPLVVARLGERGGYILGDQQLFQTFSAPPRSVSAAPGVGNAYMPDFRRSRKDVFYQKNSWQALADRIGVPAGALQNSIERARASSHPASLDQPPFFAMGPVRALLIQTNGGLRVSTSLEVLSEVGEPIPGLFAAGNAGQGGILLLGYGHHLGWAFTSGRIAGRNAARNRT